MSRMPSDRLVIADLTVQCRLGIEEWEQEKPQPIQIDLELAIDAARAAKTDDVQESVDYGRLVTAVRELAERKPYRLMETLAEEIASLILAQFVIPRVLVRVKKRALPGIDYAAVEIERARRPSARRGVEARPLAKGGAPR